MHIQEEGTAAEPVRLFRINTGSCNGCDVELAVTSAVAEFDVAQLGCRYTESAQEADILLITGPLTVAARDEVLRLHSETPRDRITVAVGVCPVSGGVFRDSYAVDGPLERHLPVDVNVPGCPPRPQAMLAGIAEALELRRVRLGGEATARRPVPADNFPARGRLSYDAKVCVDCRMCRHVCAAGAIRFEDILRTPVPPHLAVGGTGVGEDAIVSETFGFSHPPGPLPSREGEAQAPLGPSSSKIVRGGVGVRLTLWHNSCVFCGLCCHYCPTGALSATGDWRLVHRAADRFRLVERGEIPYAPCSGCGEPIIPAASELLHAAFRRTTPEIERLKALCPACRQRMSIGAPRR